jgi:hypothetical protein
MHFPDEAAREPVAGPLRVAMQCKKRAANPGAKEDLAAAPSQMI